MRRPTAFLPAICFIGHYCAELVLGAVQKNLYLPSPKTSPKNSKPSELLCSSPSQRHVFEDRLKVQLLSRAQCIGSPSSGIEDYGRRGYLHAPEKELAD